MAKTIKNGATVLLEKIDHEAGIHVVLCKWGDKFVTWQLDKEGNAYWGNYFALNRVTAAMEDFHARGGTTLRARRMTAEGKVA